MAKTKTNTASTVEEKNSTVEVETPVTETTETVETTEKTVEEKVQEKPVKAETEKTVTDKEIKKFGDNEKVVVKCVSLAGKKLSLPTRLVDFDENGKCEVNGAEANRLLTIPGYELAK